jgi:L-aspartate oxidase
MKSLQVDRTHETDVLVIGSGVAGLTAALGLAPLSVTLLTKKEFGFGSSSRLAQGGVAAALRANDSPDLHTADTLMAGAGLSDQEVVRLLTHEGPEQISRLIDLGAAFDTAPSGELLLGKEGAHSARRIVHAGGDATGAELVRVLTEAVLENPAVRVVENCFAGELITDSGRIVGVLGRLQDGTWARFLARATILATGGIGSVYSKTTNPPEANGDGLAMAARVGVCLADLEFVQFHPTALNSHRNPMPLLTEALRGEGAILVDSEGHRFMPSEHPLAELAPRDVVARAIWKRLEGGQDVFLDGSEVVGELFPRRFPTVYKSCIEHGIDPRTDPMPVSPAAHYHIGGIATDVNGRSSLPGLWACGETAATHVHGANRLASNSLLEALVFGSRVVRSIRSSWGSLRGSVRFSRESHVDWIEEEDSPEVRARIRTLMWERVGLIRDAAGLTRTLEELSELDLEYSLSIGELRNMITVARLVTKAALARRESRGVHYRTDFPDSDPSWQRHLFVEEPLFESVGHFAQAR